MLPSRTLTIEPLDRISIAGHEMGLGSLPYGLVHRTNLGILLNDSMATRRIHIDEFVCHPRAIKTASGDFLLMFAAGPMHYAWAGKARKGNDMFIRRSSDGGASWSEPQIAWELPYSQHAAILFRPKTTGDRLYAFGTEPRPDVYDGVENAAIGFRFSEDDGRTWSGVKIIEPVNDPAFRGMSAMRMCETQSGAWLLGSHAGEWSGTEGVDRRVRTRQYVLRTEDQGATWQLLPGASPNGWFAGGYDRMDEGRPIHLGDDKVLLMVRTPAGYLWELRSNDAGKTWSTPAPTPLAHPDAPPMLFHLDEKTLVAFHHNRNVQGMFSHENRTELWFSLSENNGLTWSEPRFVLANTAQPAVLSGWGGATPMVSYADLLVDGDDLHLFIDHQMRQILHVRFTRQTLLACPTRTELFHE